MPLGQGLIIHLKKIFMGKEKKNLSFDNFFHFL